MSKLENAKLKIICDKIWYNKFCYESPVWPYNWRFFANAAKLSELSIKDIIFTKEFMDKFNKYRIHQLDLDVYWQWKNSRLWEILDNLDNPVEFLYNLIK